MRVFLEEISIWIDGLSKADGPPQRGWAVSLQSTEGLSRTKGRRWRNSLSTCPSWDTAPAPPSDWDLHHWCPWLSDCDLHQQLLQCPVLVRGYHASQLPTINLTSETISKNLLSIGSVPAVNLTHTLGMPNQRQPSTLPACPPYLFLSIWPHYFPSACSPLQQLSFLPINYPF